MEVVNLSTYLPPPTYEPYVPDPERDAVLDPIYTGGLYWIMIGNTREKEKYHYIVFKDNDLIVDGQNRGNVSLPSNQPFIKSLEHFKVPDEFYKDGTHIMDIRKIGDTGPVEFNGRYFLRMREMCTFDYPDSDIDSDYNGIGSSSDEDGDD
ncbi:hypothetical protein ACHQM5_022257 [Ranunculus cassubicifolius]